MKNTIFIKSRNSLNWRLTNATDARSEEPEMKCPVCQTPDLLMTDRQGIEIDYCGTCRGVWLDRGELDKLIERASEPAATAPAIAPALAPSERRNDDYREDPRAQWGRGAHAGDGYHDRRYPLKKKKSLFGEIFDFD
jgi:uncharacterized protein